MKKRDQKILVAFVAGYVLLALVWVALGLPPIHLD